MKSKIIKIEQNGIASEMGVEPGDILLEINAAPVRDVFDYRYLSQNSYLEILIEKKSGEQWLLEVEKDEYEDLGLEFDNGLMDQPKSCKNKCVFCFIDQLPPGMRDTLYFKDDDPRLSFLTGNYVSLTNMSDEDLQRIIYYHLSPINISVHSTELSVRKFMMKNPNANKILMQIEALMNAGIEMNFQVVLCKSINDGIILQKTVECLSGFFPQGKSLSVVPAGLSKYRDKLHRLEGFTKNDCREVLEQIKQFQDKFIKTLKTRFVYAADEFYLKADEKLPSYEEYEEFPQLENGVGMLALFEREFNDALNETEHMNITRKKAISVLTGTAAYKFISKLCQKATNKLGMKIYTYPIINNYFGNDIIVSGLLTGTDILNQLKGKELGDELLIPENTLRDGENVFLDGMDIAFLAKELEVKIQKVPVDGEAFWKRLSE